MIGNYIDSAINKIITVRARVEGALVPVARGTGCDLDLCLIINLV